MALAPLRKTKGCRVGHRAITLATTLDSEHVQLLIACIMSLFYSNVKNSSIIVFDYLFEMGPFVTRFYEKLNCAQSIISKISLSVGHVGDFLHKVSEVP